MRPIVKLWEICDILDKKRKPITQKDRTKWIYPYYWASWVLDYVADYIFDEDLVLIWEDWAKWWALDNSAFKVSWKVWVNNHAHVIRPHREKILDDYLVYYLVSTDLSDYITWTTVPKLNQERLKLIEIPLPPLETQKAIVTKLDQIFAELDQTKSEIQKNLGNTDELWKSALNQAFQGDWEMKTLQDVCLQKITDWTHQTPTYCGEKDWIPFISSKDVTKEYIDREWWIKYIPQSLHEELYKRIAPQKDDVLLAKNWTTWVAAIVEDDRVFDIYVTLAVLRPNQKIITPRFLHRIVNSPICKRQFDKSLKWAGVPNLHLENIKTVTIPVPPLSEQEKIVEHLDQVSKEVKALKSQYQSQLDNLEELKKSVLDKAFKWEMGE